MASGSVSSSGLGDHNSLRNVRILLQERPNPTELGRIHEHQDAFRVVVFAYHLGLSMLENHEGRRVLVQTGRQVWEAWTSRGRRGIALGRDAGNTTAQMGGLVDRFLVQCRADPPNFIISNRVSGEAETQRITWYDGNPETEYHAKRAVLVFVSKIVVDNTIHHADTGSKEDFHKNLFLLALALAHELVHIFVGRMGGDIGKYTPPRVSTSEPPSSEGTGESGRVWEKEVFGFLPEAYYEEKNPPEQEQAGAIFCQLGKNKARLMDPAWMMNILKFRLEFPGRTIGKEFKILSSHTPMQLVRRGQVSTDTILRNYFGSMDGLRGFVDDLNQTPGFSNIRSSGLQDIRRMIDEPRRIRVGQA